MTAPTPSPTSALEVVGAELGRAAVPEWIAHIISSLEGVVSGDVWLRQYAGDWNEIVAIRDAFEFAATYRWMSRDDFVRKLLDPATTLEIPQQRMERFIVVEVLKELLSQLDRSMVVSITRSLAANLMSHAFQRVSADYTWDRVVFDTIPFMVDFAQKMLTAPPPTPSTADPIPPPSFDNSARLYAWHLYIEMESMVERLAAARAAATDLMKTRSEASPLHECCRGLSFTASDVAAVLVVEHRQNGDAARLTDAHGQTVLHYAVHRRDDDAARLIRVLFSAGADLNARNARGLSPLVQACAVAASTRIVEELLSLDGISVGVGDIRGLTALHYAVRVQRGQLVRALVEHGDDPNVADRDGFTPAHVAASSGSVSMLELLASLGTSLERRSVSGLSPLSIASCRHHLQAVLFLFQTRNHLAAREEEDSAAKVRAVLREQLPDLGRIPQVSISGLGLDHLPVELGHLRSARRLDVRHNSLKTFWLTPWWWLPVFSRRINSRLQAAFFLVWIAIVSAAMFTWSSASVPSASCPFAFRLAHVYVVVVVVVVVAGLLSALRSDFLDAAEAIEAQARRQAPFRPGQFANVLALGELFVEHVQLAALAHSTLRPTPVSAVFRAVLFDFGPGPARHLVAAVAIGLVYLLRVWVEVRSFMPRIWAYDAHLLRPAMVALLPGVVRALLGTLLDDPAHPTSAVLLVFGVGAFLSAIPIGVFGEVALQLRDADRQLRTPPGALVTMRATMLILIGADVVLNQEGVAALRYQRLMAAWMLPAALIWMALLGGRRLARDTPTQVRASTIWAAWLHAACLALRPSNGIPEAFALISWPVTIVALGLIIAVDRCRYRRRFSQQVVEDRARAQHDVLFQCFRLHPMYKAIARDFDGVALDDLERRYGLDHWLRDQYGPVGIGCGVGLPQMLGFTAIMSRVQQDLPVNLPPL